MTEAISISQRESLSSWSADSVEKTEYPNATRGQAWQPEGLMSLSVGDHMVSKGR